MELDSPPNSPPSSPTFSPTSVPQLIAGLGLVLSSVSPTHSRSSSIASSSGDQDMQISPAEPKARPDSLIVTPLSPPLPHSALSFDDDDPSQLVITPIPSPKIVSMKLPSSMKPKSAIPPPAADILNLRTPSAKQPPKAAVSTTKPDARNSKSNPFVSAGYMTEFDYRQTTSNATVKSYPSVATSEVSRTSDEVAVAVRRKHIFLYR